MKTREKKQTLIEVWASVKTTKEDPSDADSWTEKARSRRRWGVRGTVIACHNSHGLCYDVEHSDGTVGCYNPTELEVL